MQNRQALIQTFNTYLRQIKDAQLKDWPLIADLSPQERKIRADYLSGASNIKPFRGAGIASTDDYQQFIEHQQRVIELFQQYVAPLQPINDDYFLAFFHQIHPIYDQLQARNEFCDRLAQQIQHMIMVLAQECLQSSAHPEKVMHVLQQAGFLDDVC